MAWYIILAVYIVLIVLIIRLMGRAPKDCAVVMMAVKLVRESYKHKRDNLVDLCGYANILNEIEDDAK